MLVVAIDQQPRLDKAVSRKSSRSYILLKVLQMAEVVIKIWIPELRKLHSGNGNPLESVQMTVFVNLPAKLRTPRCFLRFLQYVENGRHVVIERIVGPVVDLSARSPGMRERAIRQSLRWTGCEPTVANRKITP